MTEYVVVGAGAIGGTIGARLARDGHSVLFCDADPDHVAAINANGITIEGPVETFTVAAEGRVARASSPTSCTRCCSRSSRSTRTPRSTRSPRGSAADGFVVSLQNGINEPQIAGRIGAERTVGAFVNFGADYLEPGRIFVGGRGALYVGELDGRRERAARAARARPARTRRRPRTSSGSSGRRRRTARCCSRPRSPTSRSQMRWPSPGTAACSCSSRQEVLAAAPVPVEPFDGFDADDLDGSIDRLVEFNRALGEDALRHLPRPDGAQATDGEVDAGGDRRTAASADARADRGDRRRPAERARSRTSTSSPPTSDSRSARPRSTR